MPEPKSRVQAVDIASELIFELQAREHAGITELSDATGYAKSAVHTQLATLEANDLVVQSGTKYRLSLQFLDLAESVKDQIGKYDVIKSEVDALAKETGEVVQFGTEEHGWLVYLYKAKGEQGVETASSIGKQEHLHSTSLGKAMLAHFPEKRVNSIVEEHGLPKKTERTPTDKDHLMDELETIREQEYAIDDEENVEGLRCIGTAVLSDNQGVLGALSISGPTKRITDERIEDELKESVWKSANVIQVNYKFS